MNGEDFYKNLAGEWSDDSKASEIDPEEIAKSLEGMDDLDATLFGTKKTKPAEKGKMPTENNKTNKQNANPEVQQKAESETASKKQKFNFGEFDEDDPLAGLLSDEDEESVKPSVKKSTPSKNLEPITLSPSKVGKVSDKTFEKNENSFGIAPIQEKNSPVMKPKATSSKPSQQKDIDFGNDKDVLGSLGLDDSPKSSRKIMSSLFNTDTEVKDKQSSTSTKLSETSFLDKLKSSNNAPETSNKTSNEDFLFGSYEPSVASVTHGRRNEQNRISSAQTDHSSKRQEESPFNFLDKDVKNSTSITEMPRNVRNQNSSSRRSTEINGKNGSVNRNAADDWLGIDLNPSKEIKPDAGKSGTNTDKNKPNKKGSVDDWLDFPERNANSTKEVASDTQRTKRRSSISWLDSEDSAFHSRTTSTPRDMSDKKSVENLKEPVSILKGESQKLREKNSSSAINEDIQMARMKGSTEKYLDDTSLTISDNKTTSAFDFGLSDISRDHVSDHRKPDLSFKTISVSGNEKLPKESVSGESLSNALLQLQTKVESIEQERTNYMNYIQTLQTNHQQQLTALIETHQSQIKQLEQENKSLEIRNVKEKETLQRDYENKMVESHKEWRESMKSYHEKLETVHRELFKEIADMKRTEVGTLQDLKSSLEESFEKLRKLHLKHHEEGSVMSGNGGLTGVMQNCLSLLKQQADDFGRLKKQLEEEKHTTLKEREAIVHEKELNLLKQKQASNSETDQQMSGFEKQIHQQKKILSEEWERLESSRQKFIAEQETKKQELKKEIEEYVNAQFKQRQEFLNDWQHRLEEYSASLEAKNHQWIGNEQPMESSDDESKTFSPGSIRVKKSRNKSERENGKLKNWQKELEEKSRHLEKEEITLAKDRKTLEEEQQALRNLAEQVKQKSEEAENMCMIATKIREEGLASLDSAKTIKKENEAILASIQKKLQALRKKEEFLNKEKFSLLNQTKSYYSYSVCRKCMAVEEKKSEQVQGIPYQNFSLDNNRVTDTLSNDYQPIPVTNRKDSSLPSSSHNDNPHAWFYESFPIEHFSRLDYSSSKEEKNFINSLNPSIISWQMMADQDRKILEKEKLYLLSISQRDS